jgi:hypothetical protein
VADGYHSFKKTVRCRAGQLAISADAFKTGRCVEVTTPVTGAVFVNGARIGSAPAQTVLRAGEHQCACAERVRRAETTR